MSGGNPEQPGSGGSGASSNGSGGSSGKGGSGKGGAGPAVGSGGSGSSGNPVCTPGIAATSQIPRLSNAQYDRTLRDLVGVQGLTASGNAPPSSLLATDQAAGLTALGWSAYTTVADMVAKQVMADATLKARFLKCTPAAGDTTCLHDTIIEFGRRAFRRPLSTAEVASFDKIIANGAAITPTGAPEEVAEALLYMFLISPSFLQRSEIAEVSDGAGHFTLSSHEVASRLSYVLWGSTPDAVLDQAADNNQLQTQAQILAQAERMLQDPKAREMISSFHRYYLLMGTNTRWSAPKRDTRLFPAFSEAIVPALSQETELLFDDIVVKHSGTFQDLLLTTKAFVNNQTAPLYGLNAADFGAEFKEVNLDATQRPGFLTRVGFLNAYSAFTRTSPILRGAFITKQVIGIKIGSPPPGAETTELPSTADLDTNRKQVDAQTSAPTCAGCHHTYINPMGFLMESYDAAGSWRTKEANGVAIDTVVDATIEGDVPVRINNSAELMQIIANSPTAQRQYAEKWVSYAYEREGNPLDACTVDTLSAKMTTGGYTVLNLITDLTQSASFRVRAVEVTQ